MVGVFVRLKLRLLASLFRSWQQAGGYLVPLLYGIPVGTALAVGLAVLGRSGSVHGPQLLVLAFAALTLGWTLGPLVAGGLDSTVDPDSLTLFPLTRRERALGLLAAGCVGMGPLLTALVCLGALIGFTPAGPGALLVVPAVIVQFALCLVTARAVTSAVSAAMRRRKIRDLVTLAGFVGILILSQLPNLLARAGQRSSGAARRAAEVAGWTPLGWAGSAARAGSAGDLLAALGWLAASLALLACVAAIWWHNLDRITDQPGAIVTASRGTTDLDTRLSRRLPYGPLRACVAKDQRYLAREPMLRMGLVAALAGSLLFSVGLGGIFPGHVTFMTAFSGALCALATANCLGVERGASWTLLATGVSWRTVLGSKLITFSALLVPLQVLLIAGVGVVTGHPEQIAAAAGLSLGIYAAALAGTTYGSVLFPSPLPVSRAGSGIFGSRTGGSGTTSALQSLILLVAMVAAMPAIAGVAVTEVLAGSAAAAVAGVIALVYGLAVLALGWTLSVRRLAGRGPEIVAALSAQRT